MKLSKIWKVHLDGQIPLQWIDWCYLSYTVNALVFLWIYLEARGFQTFWFVKHCYTEDGMNQVLGPCSGICPSRCTFHILLWLSPPPSLSPRLAGRDSTPRHLRGQGSWISSQRQTRVAGHVGPITILVASARGTLWRNYDSFAECRRS